MTIDLKSDLKTRLSEMAYGEIQVLAMVDRGVDRDLDSEENSDMLDMLAIAKTFSELMSELKNDKEDLITIQRNEQNVALQQKDVNKFLSKLVADKHIIVVQCLELGTTEIKTFLYTLKDRNILGNSKVFLLDLPQLEYMTLRDNLFGKIQL